MKPSAAQPKSEGPSLDQRREEIRIKFAAACKAEMDGAGPRPDIESFVVGLDEPERSKLRSELQQIEKSLRRDLQGTTVNGTTQGTCEFTPGDGDSRSGSFVKDSHIASVVADSPIPRLVKDYEIVGVLGRGGMGVVYKARQRGLDRVVALKMILSGGHASESELERFRSEAHAVAKLQHANIVQIHEVGEQDGLPFFSLEFVNGPSLEKKATSQPLAAKEIANLVRQLALAMEYAHKRGIIHRDLKPANILLNSDGTPKIGDFGLAKRLEEDNGKTRAGTVLGTPGYMAPEQAEAKMDQVGPRADVYSLGAIIYDLLTGRPPFRGTTFLETLEQMRNSEPAPPSQLQPGVPRDLETICLKCLQKDPNRRYGSAAALAEELDRFLAGIPILARPISSAERFWRLCRRYPRTSLLAATVAAIVVAWAITSSVLAGLLKIEKDKAKKSEADAIEQSNIAEANKLRAERETVIAQRNEESAKATADSTLKQMTILGEKVLQGLQSKRLTTQARGETNSLRDRLLETLRRSLNDVSGNIDKAGATAFGAPATYQSLGDLLRKLGQWQEAVKAYQSAHDILKRYVDAHPDQDLGRANLGSIMLNEGLAPLEVAGDARTALRFFQQARDIHWAVLTKPRDGYFSVERIGQSLSHDDYYVGTAQIALGIPAAAKSSFEECLKYRLAWEAVQTKQAEKTVARSYIGQAEMVLGIAASHLGDAKTAIEHFDTAVKIGKELLAANQGYTDFKTDLAELLAAYGDGLIRLGKAEESRRKLEEAMKYLQSAIDDKPDDLSNDSLLAQMNERLGVVCQMLNRNSDAARYEKQALELRTELVKLDRENVTWRAAHTLALARCGKCAEADQQAAKLLPQVKHNTELLLQLARAWARCAKQDESRRPQYTAKALEALRESTRDDYRDPIVLQTDFDLRSLNANTDFQKLLAQVKARSEK